MKHILRVGDNYAPKIKACTRLKSLLYCCILILIGASHAVAQSQSTANSNLIKGVITSAIDGQALVGATIKIKGTNQTAISNGKGEFSLKSDRGEGVLLVSFLGYIKQEVAFGSSGKSILISLEKDEQQLEEVEISTGYQNFNPERFVGAASKLDSASFHRQAGVNVFDRLRSTVTGLLFSKQSLTSPTLQLPTIRGVSSLSGSSMSPLIVVDNFPMDERFDFNSINTNDILDVSVLKDAAAASIWGSRAGNGVIVITTKKGKFNQKMDLSFSSNIGIQDKPDLFAYPKIEIADLIEIERLLFDKGFYNANLNNVTTRPIVSPVVELLNKVKNETLDPIIAEAEIAKLKNYDIRKDLEKYVHRNAVKQQHFLSARGGSSIANYTISFGYNHALNNIQHIDADNQYTLNSAITMRPAKNLEISSTLNYAKNIEKSAGTLAIPSIPYERLADENGNSLATSWQYRTGYLDTAGGGKLLDWLYRPLDEIKLTDNIRNNQSINLNIGLNYQLMEGFTALVKYNYRNQNNYNRNHNSIETFSTRHAINKFSAIKGTEITRPIPLGGILDLMDLETVSQQIRAQLNYNKIWQSDHRFSALIASEVSDTKSNRHSNTFYGYDDRYETFESAMNFDVAYPTYNRIAGTSAKISGGDGLSTGQTTRLVSFLANASYSYKSLYTLYTSARRDGSNIFGATTNNKWKPLWSAGANWNISNEAFFSYTWVNSLRLRSSFGYMGNPTGLSALTTISYQPKRDAFTNLIYATVNTPPSPELRWEEVKTLNAGIDFSLFNNRLSGNLDLFTKVSKDVIANMPIDPTAGIDRFKLNSASLKSNGIEVMLNSRNLMREIEWNTGLGFTYVKTVVTRLFENGYRAGDFISYDLNPSVGKIAYGISSYRWAGLDPATGDPQGYLNGNISKDYKGIANDSIQNQVFNGSSKPLFFGFVNNSVSFKNITLSANISYSFDYYFRNPTIQYSSLYGSSRIGHPDYYKRWQNVGDEISTTVPSLNYPSDSNRDNFYANSEINVLKADHIRLRDIRLDYQINKSALSKLPFQSIQVFIYANNLNLIIWRANKSDIDPDYVYSGLHTAFPAPRTWTAGLIFHF